MKKLEIMLIDSENERLQGNNKSYFEMTQVQNLESNLTELKQERDLILNEK